MQGEAAASTDRLIGSVFGSFRLIERIGEGAMGAVYRAEHVDLGREVAVKVLRAELTRDTSLAARFRREAQAASRIVSPHVLSPIDFGVSESGRLYMAMELLRGETLGARLAREGALPPPEALRIGLAIARALVAAHEAKVVHRDLKPDNVMLGTDGSVTVLDFGVAKIVDQGRIGSSGGALTEAGAMLGTLTYMSPEVLARKPIGPAVDVYALGLILFEMLVGRPPFQEADVLLLIGMHLRVPPELLREAKADLTVDDALERLVDTALAKETEERPTAAAITAELTLLLEGPGDDLDTDHSIGLPATLPAEPTQQTTMPPDLDGAHGVDPSDTAIESPPSVEAAQARDRAKTIVDPVMLPEGPTDASVALPPERAAAHPRSFSDALETTAVTGRSNTTARVRRVTLGERSRPILIGGAIAVAVLVGAVSYAALAGGGPESPQPRPVVAVPPPVPPPALPPTLPVGVDPETVSLPAATVGFLTVRAQPRCRVVLGERALGWTPLERTPAPTGTHALACVDARGRRRLIHTTVLAGRETAEELAPPAPRPIKRVIRRRRPGQPPIGDIQREYPPPR